MRIVLWTAVLLIGCQPPDAVVVELPNQDPAIEILHPPRDVGEIMLNEDGVLDMLVVVDIDNLEFIEPNTADQTVEGQGHWHFLINNVYVISPVDTFLHYQSLPNEFVPGPISISTTLQDNLHHDLSDSATFEAVVEFMVTAFDGSDGGGDDTDVDTGL